MATWNAIAERLERQVRLRLVTWQCDLPDPNVLPSSELESEIDDWCTLLALDEDAPLQPPLQVAPWICARLMCVSQIVRHMAGYNAPRHLPAEVLHEWLIDEWHEKLRPQWPFLARVRHLAAN